MLVKAIQFNIMNANIIVLKFTWMLTDSLIQNLTEIWLKFKLNDCEMYYSFWLALEHNSA